MLTKIVSMLCTIPFALSACAVETEQDMSCDNGRCDTTCTDKRYGDGTCQTDLACAEPDIDCFVTFDDDDAAATWFTAFEAKMAMQESRPPRSLIGQSDPRFRSTRALLDRGWEAF